MVDDCLKIPLHVKTGNRSHQPETISGIIIVPEILHLERIRMAVKIDAARGVLVLVKRIPEVLARSYLKADIMLEHIQPTVGLVQNIFLVNHNSPDLFLPILLFITMFSL